MILALFNPDNDLALANGLSTYQPPRSIKQMALDLYELPYTWLGKESVYPVREDMTLSDLSFQECQVWGWSPQVRRRLVEAGVGEQYLPSEETIAQQRAWAHRAHTIEIISYLQDSGYRYSIPHMPLRAHSYEQVEGFIKHHKRVILKQPWSSSGKGLLWVDRYPVDGRKGWIDQTIKKMGDVMCEVVYDKLYDMGMGYYIDESGVVSSQGFSFFLTDTKGSYVGNYLASDTAILEFVSQYIDPNQLLDLQKSIQVFLQERISSFHRGYLGVDLMIYKDDQGVYQLHPCVEVNLRMTMGILARRYFDRNMQEKELAVFRILHASDVDKLQQQIEQLRQQGEVELLTSLNKSSKYVAITQKISALV